MPVKEIEEIKKIHVFAYEDDIKILEYLYRDNMGVSKAVRNIIRSFISKGRTLPETITSRNKRQIWFKIYLSDLEKINSMSDNLSHFVCQVIHQFITENELVLEKFEEI